jgi:methanethiol S-methyltransferase
MVTRNDIIILIASLAILTPLLIYPGFLSFKSFSFNDFSNWFLPIINLVCVGLFLIFMAYGRKVSWKTSSVYFAIAVTLFAEMFGVILSMSFLTNAFAMPDISSQEFLLSSLVGLTIEAGIIALVFGWKQTYHGVRAGIVKRNDVIILVGALAILTPLLIYPSYLSLKPISFNSTLTDWLFVALNVAFFSIFLLFISYRKKVTWQTSSVYVAFIVALFAEMFGIPLTMWFFMSVFKLPDILNIEFLLGQVIGQGLFIDIYHYVIFYTSKVLIEIGILIVIFGWKEIYYGVKKEALVTSGLYQYSRHPQYVGFLLVTGGLLLQWPNFFTVAIWPILVFMYSRLAKKEDQEVEKEFGEQFTKYKNSVPAFFPRIRRKKTVPQ